MDERQMIRALGQFIQAAEADGIDIGHAKRFFDVGEWFLAFEEVRWATVLDKPDDFLRQHELQIQRFRRYFGDDNE
jgi:hypothetical protein